MAYSAWIQWYFAMAVVDTLLVHKNHIRLTGVVNDAAWNVFDMSPFLQHVDPKAVQILMRNNTTLSTGAQTAGVSPVGGTNLGAVISNRNGENKDGLITPVQLTSSNELRLLSPTSGDIEFYLMSEFGGDNWTNYPANVATVRSNNAWQTQDITSFVGADAGNVEGVLFRGQGTQTSGMVIGARHMLSSDATRDEGTSRSCGISVKVDNNDQFRTWVSATTGKSIFISSHLYYVGYWTRDSDLVATQDRDPGTIPSTPATDVLFNAGVQAGQESQALVCMDISSDTAHQGVVRTPGSTNVNIFPRSASYNQFPVNLNPNEECWYSLASFGTTTIPKLYVEATQIRRKNTTITASGGTVTARSGGTIRV